MPSKYCFLSLLIFIQFIGCKSVKNHSSIQNHESVSEKKDTISISSIKTSSSIDSSLILPIKRQQSFLKEISYKELLFSDLEIKTKFEYQKSKQNFSGKAEIRVKKDSLIWLSLHNVIELGRGIISKDSLVFLNRINGDVINQKMANISDILGFPVTHLDIQNLIIDDIKGIKEDNYGFIKKDSLLIVTGKEGDIDIEISYDKLKKQIVRKAFKDVKGNSLECMYDDFRLIEDSESIILPFNSLIKIRFYQENNLNEIIIKLNHYKVNISKKPLKYVLKLKKQ
jgi:hypothetical protein